MTGPAFHDTSLRSTTIRGRRIAALLAAEVVLAVVLLVVAQPGTWWPWAALGLALPCVGVLVAQPSYRSRTRFRSGPTGAARPVGAGPAPTDGQQTLDGPVRTRVVERGSGKVGVAEDGGGWFALAELGSPTDLRPDAARRPPVAVLARIFQGQADPSAVQVVVHTLPGPDALLADDAPAVDSYRHLTAGMPTAAQQISWVCVRVDACEGTVAAGQRGDDPEQPARMAAAAMLRASRLLRQAGFGCRILDDRELAVALATTGLVPRSPTPPREQRTALVVDGLRQVGYSVEPGSAAGPDQSAFDSTALPAVAVTTSTTVVDTPDGPAVRHLLRIVAPAHRIGACDTSVRAHARRTGWTVRRLDGRHAVTAYAAGPTAASLPPSGSYATAATAAGLDPVGVPWLAMADPSTPVPVESYPAVGLCLGHDVDQRPSVVRLFRRRPTEVAMVGGATAARVVAARAVASGVRVYVRTDRPADWQALASATGVPDRLQVGADRLQVGAEPPPVDPQQPILIVDELAADVMAVSDGLRPWQTRLVVLRRLTPQNARRVAGAQLAILGRLTEEEAGIAAGALGMTGDTPRALTRLPDEMVALVGGGVNSYVWLALTDWERTLGGERP
ncbi:hypothetical protein GCM10027290_62190 [Micromonospora sonneratiae]|uniref:Type VII secretion protein EccE n=1 Tax=Micromonospora sonneratiae TaxID=1184706 RepID=A0ABW3YGD4_9ACTN